MDLTRWLPTGRAVLRLAVRQTKARRGISALVVALIAVPLIAATASLAILHSLNPNRAEQLRMEFGTADLRTYGTLGAMVDALPPGSRVGTVSRMSQPVRFGERSATVAVISTGGDQGLVRSRATLRSGRWPANTTEAVVTAQTAKAQGTGLGQSISIGDRTYRVVGIYLPLRNRQAKEIQILRADESAPVSETLVELPGHRDAAQVAADLRDSVGAMMTHADVETDGSPTTSATLTQWSVILIEVSLLIGAVFAVIRGREAQQAHALAQLGATRRQTAAIAAVRALVLAVLGIVIGLAVGLGVAELARRGLQDRVPFAAPSVRVSGLELLLLAGFVLALTLAAALAALRPVGPPSAVSASGRRSAAWAVAIAAIGVGGLALAVRVDHDSPRAVLLSVSGALAVTGLALLGTELLFLLAKVRGGPPAFRIGIRDLARHRTRTRGLMIAAIAGLVGGTMAVLALTSLAARDRDTYQPRLRPGQLVLDGANQAQAQQLAQRIGGATLAPVTGAQRTMPSGETGLVLAVRPDGSQGVVAVVDRASLPAYGIPAAAVQGDGTGQAFVLVDDVAAGDVVRLASPGWRRSLTAVPVEPLLHRDSTLPAAVLTREAADALGLLTPTPPTRWVLSKTGPLTNTDWAHINALTAQYTGVAATVEEGWVDHDAAFRRGLNLGVVAFGVLACLLVTVLAEVERARTYGILHSLGCSPGRRRRIAVVSTVVLSVWFAVLATLASIPLTRIALDRTPLVVSWRTLLLNAIAVIAIAALVSMRARTRMSVIEGGTDARGSVAR